MTVFLRCEVAELNSLAAMWGFAWIIAISQVCPSKHEDYRCLMIKMIDEELSRWDASFITTAQFIWCIIYNMYTWSLMNARTEARMDARMMRRRVVRQWNRSIALCRILNRSALQSIVQEMLVVLISFGYMHTEDNFLLFFGYDRHSQSCPGGLFTERNYILME